MSPVTTAEHSLDVVIGELEALVSSGVSTKASINLAKDKIRSARRIVRELSKSPSSYAEAKSRENLNRLARAWASSVHFKKGVSLSAADLRKNFKAESKPWSTVIALGMALSLVKKEGVTFKGPKGQKLTIKKESAFPCRYRLVPIGKKLG